MVENLQSHRANAVINIIAINDVPFNANIINNERHEIKVMPEDKPSNPSIKLIAFIVATIISIEINSGKKGTHLNLIVIPNIVTLVSSSPP